MREELQQAREWARQGESVALARVIAVVGSAPRPVGAAMVISGSGQFLGSVSGGCVEGNVIAAAEEILRSGRAEVVAYSGDDDPLTEIVLGCGGSESILIERIDAAGDLLPVYAAFLDQCTGDMTCTLITSLEAVPRHWFSDANGVVIVAESDAAPPADAFVHHFFAPVRMVIVGADAVGQAVAHLSMQLGWPVTVVDPRSAWLTPLRFPHAARLVEWPQVALPRLPLDDRTAIVVLTHDAKIDEPALQVALRSAVGYVGALGSRRAQADRTLRLTAAGMTASELERLHSPIGLDLGGHSPVEMALSIIGEIVAVRNGRTGGMLRFGLGHIHGAQAEVPVG